MIQVESELLAKYDVPAPRYTSYPTVPYWEETPSKDKWIEHLNESLKEDTATWSMYLHIPYCETLCTFCGCNNTITKDHQREAPYVQNLLKEFALYLERVSALRKKPLQHIHLGGGTPTFLSADQLTVLIEGLFSKISLQEKDFEASIEVDPRRTTSEQLVALRKLGFNRVSLGVQDFDPEVQRLVNRTQPFSITQKITETARDLGYESVNFDLIYGLAKQTPQSMETTVEKTLELKPDRIALYSFALVPWIKPAQRLFKDEDLPKAAEKRELYEIARRRLLSGGYVEVGMDHFALPTDSLAQAMREHSLHRNFMGYTNQRSDVLLGLGVSAISETPWSFHQNEKVLPVYEQKIAAGEIPTLRGHVLTEEDRFHRQQIMELMTEYQVSFKDATQEKEALQFLREMISDGLVQIQGHSLRLTEKGRPFLRNACVFFDQRLRSKQPQTQIFSKSI